MKIIEFLTKNKIDFLNNGDNSIVVCPECGTLSNGITQCELHIDNETGNGKCWGCKRDFSFAELGKKWTLNSKIQTVDAGEIVLEKIVPPSKKKGSAAYKLELSETLEHIAIDTSKFKPLSSDEVLQTLGITIKKDEENKLITFLCELSAYTDSDQLNVSFNAPSSSGKSYIPTEIAQLFPKEDVIELGYCSPTAFFHDQSKGYNKETNELVVDLSRKILIFLDQPHTLLLQHLRPFLSHDNKEIRLKITDKSQKGGNRTKNILLRGFSAVIFCTSLLQQD